MDALLSPRPIQIIPPDDSTVTVIGRPRPFKAKVIRKHFAAGHTVQHLLEQTLGDEHSGLCDYAVYLDGDPIPPSWRERVRVKPGCTMTFQPRLKGGDIGRIVALVALAVVALILPPLIVPALALTGTLATVATALIGGGIILAGTMAINALLPIPPPSSPTTALTQGSQGTRPNVYSIGGANNQADPFGPVPSVLGACRVFPRYAALPVTELVGNDQYLRLLFVVGHGPLDITDLRIGETLLSNFEDVQFEVFNGYSSDTAPTLYPQQALESSISVELTFANSWQQRTTAVDVTEIALDYTFPGGLFETDKKTGDTSGRTVVLESQYRLVGTSGWTTLQTLTVQRKSLVALRVGVRAVVSAGQYDVQTRRTTADHFGDKNIQDKSFWTVLRSFRSGPVVIPPTPVAMVDFRIKATSQLNNVIDSFNCLATSRVTAATGGSPAWALDTPSNNPADLFRWVLQGPAGRSPRPDSEIDLASLEGWAAYCRTKGWKYNKEQDTSTSVLDLLREIAAAGRARVTRTDGVWGVIWDEESIPVSQHFTPRNSWGFEEQRMYQDFPDAFRVTFINEAIGFQADELIVYNDGFNATNATKFQGIDVPGVTNSDLAWKHARFHLAQAELRPSIYTLNTNWQALSCTVGSKVYCAHDVTLWGLHQGRVKTVSASPDTITLDQEVEMIGGHSYGIRFRMADGTTLLRSVITAAGAHIKTLQLASDILLPLPEAGDLFMFGEASEEAVVLRVLNIEWQADLNARLSLVDDAPGATLADQGSIPPFNSQITVPVDLFALPPDNLQTAELLYLSGGVAKAAAILSWTVVPSAKLTGFEIDMRTEADTVPEYHRIGATDPSIRSFTTTELQPGSYSFRVRSTFTGGQFSSWAELNHVDFIGLLEIPPDVTNFAIQRKSNTAHLTWDPVEVANLDHYTIRFTSAITGASWGAASIIDDFVTGTSVDVDLLVGTYLIKAVTVQEQVSLNEALIVNEITGAVDQNIVQTLTEDPTFGGTYVDVVLEAISPPAIRLAGTSGGDLVATGTYTFLNSIDLGDVFTSRLSSVLTAFGDNLLSDIFGFADMFATTDIFGGSHDKWIVTFQLRTTLDPTVSPVVWSAWINLEQLSFYTFRAAEFRVILSNGGIQGETPFITGLAVIVDMPDRIISEQDLVVTVGGLRVDWNGVGTNQAPFLTFKGLAIAAQGLATGDYYLLTNKDELGFNIIFKNAANSAVQRTFDYVARGWGRRLV